MLSIQKKTKQYLVTGGCGFIGSHLVDALIEEGHKVIILDNLSTGKIENANPKARLIIGDTTNYDTVASALINVDGCFHLAAIASVEKSITEWATTNTVNVNSTINIFQASSRAKQKIPVVYTSSAAVYGNYHDFPISENAETKPITAYGVDKLSCDLHARIAWQVHGIHNIGLRPFNVYGPRQDPSSPYSGVISIFVDRMQRGLPITIFGDGGQIRDFVYVGDVIKAFMAAMKNLQKKNTDIGHEVINICTGRPTFINQLADIIATTIGCSRHYSYSPARKGDIYISLGSPVRLAARLGVKLETTLQDGLKTIINTENILPIKKAV